ncbi:glycosyltransferase family 9 protein [Tenacibaculum agarivorans]|uniref:glycosyltransferase family 9 protein n=1 Tax=Tenacibaculum agarivorans TaxID=1908389 RepID=UPI000AF41951|nr:glycosyltransferase family 9 protein [Tenacibaculum agarivorans]
MNTKTHIIVFRLSAMGDVAMTVPVIKNLVKQHPKAQITFVSKQFLQPLFEDIPNVTFFAAKVNNRHKGFLGLIRLYKDLNKNKPTHFADLHNVLRSKIVRGLFSFFSNAKIAKIDKGRKEKKALTRKENKVFKQLKSSHERYVDVFKKLGIQINLQSDSSKKAQLNTFNTQKLGSKEKKWIGIAPFAAFESKTYPLDLMEKVIQKLSNEDLQLFLFGGKADIETLEEFQSKYSNVISVAGQLNGLKNELNLIANLNVMLSMDSANAHLAAMQNTKTIILWGNTHPYAGFAPFNQPSDYSIVPDLKNYPLLPCSVYGNRTFEGYEDVMRSIEPEIIVDKVLEIL